MKKFLCTLLVVVLMMAPFSANATQVNDITTTMMGDVDGNRKINAMDARMALRIAAKLDSAEGINILNIDADGDGKISASDARMILRVSAQLSYFVFGFDGNGTANVINTINSNIYAMKIENFDEAQNVHIQFTFARANDDVYMMSDDKEMLDSMGLDELFDINNCGMMVKNGNIYALLGTSKSDIAMFINSETQEKLDIQADMVYEIIDMVNKYMPKNLDTPTVTQLNGKEMLCYTYTADGQQCQMFIDASNGQLSHIDGILKNGNAETLINFIEISGDKNSKYFSLDSFDEIW